jgi:predicted Fe-Mo cluster-binding NifX family protein
VTSFSFKKCRVAVATNKKMGLNDSVSDVFGRAKTFTIVDVENERLSNVKVLENSAASYHHGAGPITVKMLDDEGVTVVIANELGIGASELLKQHKITLVPTKPETKVENAIKNVMAKK